MTDTTDIQAVLKYITPYKEAGKKWYEEWDFMKWLPTREDFGGRKMLLPLGYDTGGGVSHTFSDAQEAEGDPNQWGEFTIERTRAYALVYIDNEAIEAAKGDENGFIDTLQDLIDGADTSCKIQTCYELWGSGSGSIGKVNSAYTTGNTITLDDPETIFRFRKNMRLNASTADGGGTLKPGYATVTQVLEDDGQIVVDNAAAITGLAASDFLFPKGNYDKAPKGVPAYIPDATALAASPSIWGLNRVTSGRPERLAGIRKDVSTYGLAGALEMGLARCRKSNVYPDSIWVNPKYYAALSLDMGAKAQRESFKVGNFGYDTFHVYSFGRKVPVMCDQGVPDNSGFALTRKSWVWHTLGKPIRWLTTGGATSIVKPTADGVEGRRGWRGQLICKAPWDNANFTLPTIS